MELSQNKEEAEYLASRRVWKIQGLEVGEFFELAPYLEVVQLRLKLMESLLEEQTKQLLLQKKKFKTMSSLNIENLRKMNRSTKEITGFRSNGYDWEAAKSSVQQLVVFLQPLSGVHQRRQLHP